MILELPGERQRLAFTETVLRFFSRHRQIGPANKEAGGQLFARITPGIVIVAAATGPHRKDFRYRFEFIPNKNRLKKEIADYFVKGLHYVGDWHSHPQRVPRPSCLDIRSMKRCFRQSKHELEHFILVIVGQVIGPKNLWVGAIDAATSIDLHYQKK